MRNRLSFLKFVPFINVWMKIVPYKYSISNEIIMLLEIEQNEKVFQKEIDKSF